MNTMTMGFLITVGMGWALGEGCVAAGNGNWLPLIGFLAAFIFIFGAIGCLELSDGATNAIGAIFTIVLGFTLLAFAFAGYDLGSGIFLLKQGTGVFLLKLLGAIFITVAGILSLLPSGSNKADHQHS